MRRAFVVSMGIVALIGGPACSNDADAQRDVATPATGCAADTRKDVYTAGMSKPAEDLTVKLVEATPGPPAKGTNELTLELLDASARPVDGATVTVKPFMPDHAHGSAVTPVVTPSGGGRYAVSKVYLAMAGLWTLTISVQPPGGGPLKEAVFQFCVDG